MKIRIAKGVFVDSKTLVRLEWRRWYPALVVHEKYESFVKWTLRIIAFIGIASSIFAIDPWYVSLGVAFGIFMVEQFFERTVIEYTALVFQPPPSFEVEYNQWKINGFIIPTEKNKTDLPHFGPTYLDEGYAIKFFKYLRSWVNDNSNDDKENTLMVSLVIEPNEKYTTYIYANLGRKRLDYMFKFIEAVNKLEKYGKRQHNLTAQLFYWHTLDYKDGYFIKQFLEFRTASEPFMFTPSVIQPFGFPPKFIFDWSIKKYDLKVRFRREIKKNEPEYLFDPAKWENDDEPLAEDETKEGIIVDIQKVLSKAVDVGFIPNDARSVGAINLCYEDCQIPFEAYKQLIKQVNKKEVVVSIKNNTDSIDLMIQLSSINRTIHLENLHHNKSELAKFEQVNGGGQQIVLLVGYPPANKRHIILEKDISPLIITWKLL